MKFGLFCLMPQRDIRKSAGTIAAEAIEQAKTRGSAGLRNRLVR